MKVKDDLPRSDVNKEYYIQNIDAEVSYLLQCLLLIAFSYTLTGREVLLEG